MTLFFTTVISVGGSQIIREDAAISVTVGSSTYSITARNVTSGDPGFNSSDPLRREGVFINVEGGAQTATTCRSLFAPKCVAGVTAGYSASGARLRRSGVQRSTARALTCSTPQVQFRRRHTFAVGDMITLAGFQYTFSGDALDATTGQPVWRTTGFAPTHKVGAIIDSKTVSLFDPDDHTYATNQAPALEYVMNTYAAATSTTNDQRTTLQRTRPHASFAKTTTTQMAAAFMSYDLPTRETYNVIRVEAGPGVWPHRLRLDRPHEIAAGDPVQLHWRRPLAANETLAALGGEPCLDN